MARKEQLIFNLDNASEEKPVTNPTQPGVEANPFVPERWKTSPTGLYQEINSDYPLPTGIKPFKAKSNAFTNDYKANINILVNELGFTKNNVNAVYYNTYGTLDSMLLSYDVEDKDYYIYLKGWKTSDKETYIENLTPYAFKEVTRLFFGANNTVYDLVERAYKGDASVLKSFGKIFKVGNREVFIASNSAGISIFISDSNEKLDIKL